MLDDDKSDYQQPYYSRHHYKYGKLFIFHSSEILGIIYGIKIQNSAYKTKFYTYKYIQYLTNIRKSLAKKTIIQHLRRCERQIMLFILKNIHFFSFLSSD